MSLDANGFTVITPSGDSKIVYVSSSGGNDSNDGLSEGQAKATLSAGYALLRNGFPDHLLLKKGDEWTENLTIAKSGRSKVERLIFSSYGTGPRPLLKNSRWQQIGTAINYIGIVDLEFYATFRDPSHGDYILGEDNPRQAIALRHGGTGLLIEGCKIHFYTVNIDLQKGPTATNQFDIAIRRNVITDAWSDDSFDAHGLFTQSIATLLIEENVFDHNGWHETIVGAEGDTSNHNTYNSGSPTDVTCVGNIFSRGSFTSGLRMRSEIIGASGPATATNNLTYGGARGFTFDTVSSPGDFTHHDITVTENVFNDIGHDGAAQPDNSRGIQVDSLQTGNFDNNYFIHKFDHETSNCMNVGTGDTISAVNNVIHNWHKSGALYFTFAAPVTNVTESNPKTDLAASSYFDATRTLHTYDLSLGGAGTAENFLITARTLSKDNWLTAYTAPEANSWIKAGYEPPEPAKPCQEFNGTKGIPVPCVQEEVGICPPDPEESSESSLLPSSDNYSCFRAFRDCPRDWFDEEIGHITMGSILQYVWKPGAGPSGNPRRHSYIFFRWTSKGTWKTIGLDNFQVPEKRMWNLDEPEEQQEDELICVSSSSSSSGESTTEVLVPNSKPVIGGWVGDHLDVDEGVDTNDGNSTTMQGKSTATTTTLGFPLPSMSGTITKVKVRIACRQDSGFPASTMSFRGRTGAQNLTLSAITPPTHDTLHTTFEVEDTGTWASSSGLEVDMTVTTGGPSPDIWVTAVEIIITYAPGALDSSDNPIVEKGPVLARFMVLRGLYNCLNPDMESSSNSSDYNPNPDDVVPTIMPSEIFECLDDEQISDTDPSMSNQMSEMAIRIERGSLTKVYFGGMLECEDNPLIWHRDNPPPDAGMIVIPVIQAAERALGESTWSIWLLYFDTKGYFVKSCLYMEICSCQPSCSHAFCDSSDQQPFCVCLDVCLQTQGCQALGSSENECPAALFIDCEEALTVECRDDILVPGTCDYVWVDQCCQVGAESSIIQSSLPDGEGITQGCKYLDGVPSCVTADDPDRDTM